MPPGAGGGAIGPGGGRPTAPSPRPSPPRGSGRTPGPGGPPGPGPSAGPPPPPMSTRTTQYPAWESDTTAVSSRPTASRSRHIRRTSGRGGRYGPGSVRLPSILAPAAARDNNKHRDRAGSLLLGRRRRGRRRKLQRRRRHVLEHGLVPAPRLHEFGPDGVQLVHAGVPLRPAVRPG